MKWIIMTIIICFFIYLICGMIIVPYNYRKSNKILINNVIKVLENVIYEQDVQVIKTKVSDAVKILKEVNQEKKETN